MRKIILSLLALIPIFGLGQSLNESRLDSLSGALVNQIRSSQSENLYLTTDRSIYLPGESVWFRTFLENQQTGQVSQKSQSVILRLVNQKDTVIHTLLLETALDQMSGKIDLPERLPGGYYWLVAYTYDMIRNHRGTPGSTPIYVYNSDDRQGNFSVRPRVENPSDSPMVKFYPEGGNLITGAPSLMAIKITQNEVPLRDSGFVVDERDQITGKFVTNQFGVAGFTFEPSHFKTYQAQLTWNQQTFHYPLPPFNPLAGQVSVSFENPELLKVRVLLEDSLYNLEPQTCLVALSGDSLCFASIGNGNYQLGLSTTKFPPGIAHFLLFSNSMKLLSERSVYIPSGVAVDVSLDPASPGPNKMATLHLHLQDPQGQP
ncbi:MAG: hypothetical protein KGM98_10810, partial [Bacteroidota bacterium]|nr:hypothetical protein [Bacteroidota bacterium]